MPQTPAPLYEFHISRRSRERYQFDETLFATSGNVIFANFHASRTFAQKMNQKRDLARFPEQAVRAGQINAMGLIDEILHLVSGLYRREKNPAAGEQALNWLHDKVGAEVVQSTLRRFAQEFPPAAVYRRQIELDEYLNSETGGVPHDQVVLEELLMLWLANTNPAFAPFSELFDDSTIDRESPYRKIIPAIHEYFSTQPPFGPDGQNLVDMLRSPAIASPHSLSGQLEYIRTRWGLMLGKYLYRLLSSMDFMREEEKAVFGVGGQGPARVLEFGGLELEPERFSPDKEWMPSLVLMAKNAFVWLDQLSKKYRRAIATLADIPDDELDALSRAGFSGLWLIGLWERSTASKNIKILRGNPDAVASAYSLADYAIANDLGGDAAYENLRQRCWARGIRLASDMVPNHMGIDSRWVVEHPDWFVALDYPPFPAYTFNGPNFSWHDRVGLYIEDHYFDNTDAAVVFKRVDFNTGETKYIYHGNDGTSMPWNDTAQLDYLKPEVREAVIQTILHVARKFPVIRFDAAMTLAKKHYQRLWFPEPGTGGAIPSRAEFGLTKDQFDAAFPLEFWREVVDRVAQEVPDTLLLAEAFWLMEGYFVRTLGMHRVYNSAFMNMLRDEKNLEYRLVIKNTLEFDPEILKRYVNFMNNPDERTAVDQFGKGDKYFGICTLMATLPGLPMFGHGQLEGYTEKYGMEYRRAYWDEQPDSWLMERHAREVFPLLRKRYLFAEVENFLLFDFYTPEGSVNEDVYAYSNRRGEEKSLVVYHNRFASTRGWVRQSAAFAVKAGGDKQLASKILADGMGLENGADTFTIYRDQLSGLEYIRPNAEIWEKGLYVELEAYKCHVFLDFGQVQDNQYHQYRQVCDYLQGRGVPSVEEALKELFLQPIHQAYREIVNRGFFHWLYENRSVSASRTETETERFDMALDEAQQKSLALLVEIKRLTAGSGDENAIAQHLRALAGAALDVSKLAKGDKLIGTLFPASSRGGAKAVPAGYALPRNWGILFSWLFSHRLGQIVDASDAANISSSWLDEWLLGKIIAAVLQSMGQSEADAWRGVGIARILVKHGQWQPAESIAETLNTWLADADVQGFLGVNRWQGVLWFNHEAFQEFLAWLTVAATLQIAVSEGADFKASSKQLAACRKAIARLQAAEEQSGYQIEKLLEAASSAKETASPVPSKTRALRKPSAKS